MVHCAAVNCNNNTYKKDQNTGVSFCRLPKDKALKEKWVINLKRENPPNDVRLCCLYFEDPSLDNPYFVSFSAVSNVLIISFLLCLEILKNIESKII